MAPRMRICPECGEPNIPAGSRKKTCSDSCRTKRSRRIRREEKHPNAVFGELGHGEGRDVAIQTIQEELRPVVREAITQEVLEAIGELVGLAPKAIRLIEADLDSDDPNVRQRAYTLLTKYTLGNPSVAPSPEVVPPAFVVHFDIPRPNGRLDNPPDEAVLSEAMETKECATCFADKPLAEFVGGSDRCRECHDAILAKRDALLAPAE